ncbi:hypothetical protein F5146DRAFT_1060683 [Armillaria mellea]|nr:hypothetical protein F5146DRAFT_1060683 [Armillaria mellea]
MPHPSRATDANDYSLPNDTLCSPDGFFELSDLWNDVYDDSAAASDITALDFDTQAYNNHASLLASLPDLATDYAMDYYPPAFFCAEEISGYGVMSGEAMANYPPYYYGADPSSSLIPTHDSQPATQQERLPPPTQLESNDCHTDQSDAPKARIIRKKGRRPRAPAANEESQPPLSVPCPPDELGELGPSIQRANPRTSRAPWKRKLDSTPPHEVDRVDKRRRRNTHEEEAIVRPRRSRRLSEQQRWEQASYHEDDSSSTRSLSLGEPGPSTWAQNADVPSPGIVDSDQSWEDMSAQSKISRCRRCRKVFKRNIELRRHCKWTCRKSDVSGDRDKSRLECPVCHKVLSRPDALLRHRQSPSACGGKISKGVKKAKRSEEEDEAWGE